MTERGGYDDEALLADLGEAWRDVAPVAAALTTRAQAAFSWRTVDADLELAALHFDSAAHSGVSSRAPEGAARVLVFSSTPLTVELEVLPDQLVGQLVPPGAGDVTVETDAGTTTQVRSD